MVFAAAVVPVVRIWLALSLVEVSVMDPLLANAAVNPIIPALLALYAGEVPGIPSHVACELMLMMHPL